MFRLRALEPGSSSSSSSGSGSSSSSSSGSSSGSGSGSANFQIDTHKSDDCTKTCTYLSCLDCTADPECGWYCFFLFFLTLEELLIVLSRCNMKNRCQHGDKNGPLCSACSAWSYGTCGGERL